MANEYYIDPRMIHVNSWDDSSLYRLPGRSDVAIEFSVESDDKDEYCWSVVELDSIGRMLSGIYYTYFTSCDAVDAILRGDPVRVPREEWDS